MTAATLSLTEDQTLAALRGYLLTLLGTDIEVVAGQDNRVAAPAAANYVVMTPMLDERLATNVTTFHDGYFDQVPGAGLRYDLVPSQVTVQLDFHGPKAHDLARVARGLFRTDVAVAAFKASGFDVTPLHCAPMRQAPFISGEQQVENVWQLDAVMQTNPVITTGQDFAMSLKVNPLSVAVSVGELSIKGTKIYNADGTEFVPRGWSWGRWGTFKPQDAIDAAAAGANIIRIPLRFRGLYGNDTDVAWSPGKTDSYDPTATTTALANAENIAVVDSMIDAAFNAGMKVHFFIDTNCGQNAMQDAATQLYCCYGDDPADWPQGRNLWTDPVMWEQFKALWRFAAARWKDRVSIFEPQPEPNPASATDQEISDKYDELIGVIDAIAPGKLYVVGPRSYKMTIPNQALLPNRKNIIYTGDLFMRSNGDDPVAEAADRLSHLTGMRDTKQVPIIVQQVGVNTSDDDASFTRLKAVLQMLVDNRVGYEYWQLRGAGPDGYEPMWPDRVNGGWLVNQLKLDTINSFFRA
jgi:hypothetical protein